MIRPRDPDRAAALAAEAAAYEDTALAIRPGAELLCAEATTFMESMWWTSTFGARRVGVEPVQRPSDPTGSFGIGIGGGVIEIRFSATTPRYAVFRELAHAAVAITRTREPSHGHAWRTWYVTMLSAAYGTGWAERLADAFADAQLSVGHWDG